MKSTMTKPFFRLSLATLSSLSLASVCLPVTASAYAFAPKSITVNDKQVSTPQGFVANGTTYVPIWYLMQALKQLNIANTWDGSHWNLTVNETVDTSNPNTTTSGKSILINGTLVTRAPAIVTQEPGTHHLTTYMPIWYLQQTLKRLGMDYTWDGSHWNILNTHPLPPAPAFALTTQTIVTDNGYANKEVTGFYNQTEYMDLDAVHTALNAFGVTSLFDANGQPYSSLNVVSFQGKDYVSVWSVMTALKSLGNSPSWDGHTFRIAKYPVASHVVNPNQTYSYTVMQRDIQTLASMYPDLIQVKVVGQTAYGRNIYAIGLGKGKATVFINGSHHAREWITTTLNMYMMDHYAYSYRNHQSIGGYDVENLLNQATIWFIPMVNPDGVSLEQFGANAFPSNVRASLIQMNHGSTNFADWKNNAQGIDPNRQYDGGWYSIPTVVNHPWFDSYKGTAPYQINEVQAVLNLIGQVNPQAEVSYHASGGVIYWGYQVSAANQNTFHGLAERMHNLTGYPVESVPGYEQGGGLTDWWTHNVGRPGFTIEVGPTCGTNPVPTQYFSSIWAQNQAVGLELAQEGIAKYNQDPTSTVRVP